MSKAEKEKKSEVLSLLYFCLISKQKTLLYIVANTVAKIGKLWLERLFSKNE